MAYALISPNETVRLADGTEGIRICDISATEFPVAEPLFWATIPDGTDIQSVHWNGTAIIPNPSPTLEETISIISSEIQSALDAGAQKWNYQDLATAASYANSTIPQYAADAKALIAWRDAVWSWAIPQFATIVAGTDPQTFMANMPVQPTQPKV